MSKKTIRASEIGEYLYCARAWWLRRALEMEPAGRERRELGTALHVHHGRTVALSRILLICGLVLLVVAAVAALWG